MKPSKAIFSWSGGKDSSLCLHHVLHENIFDVCYLLTSINGNNNRVSLHGVREELIEAQAKSIGIPLIKAYVYEGTNEEYEKQMNNELLKAKAEGITTVIFGDIFLEDLRKYREDKLNTIGMRAVFPLWKKNTLELVNNFISLKYKSIICSVNDAYLNENHLGQIINNEFIKPLPELVDPCGENGEFHSFCYEGEIFRIKINIETLESIYKELPVEFQIPDKNNRTTKGFWYKELHLKT